MFFEKGFKVLKNVLKSEGLWDGWMDGTMQKSAHKPCVHIVLSMQILSAVSLLLNNLCCITSLKFIFREGLQQLRASFWTGTFGLILLVASQTFSMQQKSCIVLHSVCVCMCVWASRHAVLFSFSFTAMCWSPEAVYTLTHQHLPDAFGSETARHESKVCMCVCAHRGILLWWKCEWKISNCDGCVCEPCVCVCVATLRSSQQPAGRTLAPHEW